MKRCSPRYRAYLFWIVALMSLVQPLTAMAQSPTTVTETQETFSNETIETQLLGEWQTTDPTTGEALTLIFAPENRLYMIVPAEGGSSVAIAMRYEINPATVPVQLNLILNSTDVAETVFEFTPSGQLRLQIEGIEAGNARPTELGNSASIFERRSNTTTLPETMSVIELESENSQAQASIPVQFIMVLAQAQQAYHQNNGEFARNVEELELATTMETASYVYQIKPQVNATEAVGISASAKEKGLPSYTGAVFIPKGKEEKQAITTICQTDSPSRIAPAMPQFSWDESAEVVCPTGSTRLNF